MNAKDNTGMTPLHYCAVGRRHPWKKPFTELLLANKAGVDVRDQYGRTPLHVAAESGYVAVAEVLIAHAASVNIKWKYPCAVSIRVTPSSMAARTRSAPAV